MYINFWGTYHLSDMYRLYYYNYILFLVSHGQSANNPYGATHTASAAVTPYLYSAAALYPSGPLASYNSTNYEESNGTNRSSNNNATGPVSTSNVDATENESPVASGGRMRTGGSSVGSEGDISSTLSPGNGSSGIRDSQDAQHSDTSRGISTSGVGQRWDGSNGVMAAALEAVVARNPREVLEEQLGQMSRSGTSNQVGGIHEDVWRPYWVTSTTT